jgi:DNA replication protein DnaC
MQEDYKPVYIPCRTCVEQQGKKIARFVPQGYLERVFKTESGEPRIALEHCKCHIKYLNDVRTYSACKRAGIHPMYMTYNVAKDYVGERSSVSVYNLGKYIAEFAPDNEYGRAMLYLHGMNGTQKTSCAKWVCASIIRRGFSARYLLMNDLLRLLMDAQQDKEKQDEVAKLVSIDLLIIDESFDKEKVTIYASGYQIPFLDSFIRKRFETCHGIMFVSNIPPNEIEKNKYSHSIQDFVERNLMRSKAILTFEDNYVFNKEHYDSDKGLF